MAEEHIFTGQKVIVRCYASGVHFGTLESVDGRHVVLTGSRRLWRWHTGGEGVSLSEISQTGIDQSRSVITVAVPTIALLDALEIIPTTAKAAESIETAKVGTP